MLRAATIIRRCSGHRVDAAYQAFITNHRQYARLVKENEKKQYRMESLKKSLEELEKARLKLGEEETLVAEKRALPAFREDCDSGCGGASGDFSER